MKASNLADVGQIRSRKGTSIKRMTNEQALRMSVWCIITEDWPDLQADGGEGDAGDGRKKVGNTECKAQDHAQHAGPKRILSEMRILRSQKNQACPKSSTRNRHPSGSPQCSSAVPSKLGRDPAETLRIIEGETIQETNH